MPTISKHILVIEDNPEIGQVLQLNLMDEGYVVELATDGESGLAKLAAKPYDLLLLDIMLPGIDGLEVCRRLRSQEPYTPIIIISSRSAEAQRIVGLEMGADDVYQQTLFGAGAGGAGKGIAPPRGCLKSSAYPASFIRRLRRGSYA